MTNQLGKFTHNLAELTQPLRQLLSKNSTWLWGAEQDQAFAKVKTELTKLTVLAPQAPAKISAGAPSYRLEAVILQESETNGICFKITDRN